MSSRKVCPETKDSCVEGCLAFKKAAHGCMRQRAALATTEATDAIAPTEGASRRCQSCGNDVAPGMDADHEDWCSELGWKKRALEAEELNRKFMASVNGPAHMGEPVIAAPSPKPAVDALTTGAVDDAKDQIEHMDVENHRLRNAIFTMMKRLTELLDEDQFAEMDSIALAAGVTPPGPASATVSEFKNFHRLLCERFGYVHDEVDWRRDQLSLIEHIATHPADATQSDALTTGAKGFPKDGDSEETRIAFRDYDRRELARTKTPWQIWRDAIAYCASAPTCPASEPKAAAIHYPECWDTAAYPTVESAISGVYAAFKCTNHIGASAPKALTDERIIEIYDDFYTQEDDRESSHILPFARALLADRGS